MVFSEDKKNVLACVGDLILVYDLESGKMSRAPIKGLHKGNIHCLVFSQNGQKFATGSQDK